MTPSTVTIDVSPRAAPHRILVGEVRADQKLPRRGQIIDDPYPVCGRLETLLQNRLEVAAASAELRMRRGESCRHFVLGDRHDALHDGLDA